MERYEISQDLLYALPAWIALELEAELRFASSSLATATLVVLLVCATREGIAQTGATGDSLGGNATTTVALVSTGGSPPAAAVLPTIKVQQLCDFDALLAVRGGSTPITARQTDAAIAAATARGHAKDLERPQPFRKKSTDLFRTQREVQIGNQEMLVRLRLRAKTRNAMSVELRF